MEKLNKVQLELKAAKDKKNQFGGFNYRNIEAIYTELKPILARYNCHLKMTSDLVQLGDETFIKVIGTFVDLETNYEETAVSYAAIDFQHKGMSKEQATGSAQSYASKYCLNHLFLLDDGSLDPDTMEPKGYEAKNQPQQPVQEQKTAAPQQTTYQPHTGGGIDFKTIDNMDTLSNLEAFKKNTIDTCTNPKVQSMAMEHYERRKKQLEHNLMSRNYTYGVVNQ